MNKNAATASYTVHGTANGHVYEVVVGEARNAADACDKALVALQYRANGKVENVRIAAPSSVPTPWSFVVRPIAGRGAIRVRVIVVDGDLNDVCEAYGETEEQARAHAAFIVAAANATREAAK
jgi:hypothetical protein